MLGADSQKLAGHAQVDQQHLLRVELDKNVFSAAADGFDTRAAEFSFEGSRRRTGEQSRQIELRGHYASSEDSAAQRAHDMFNLW